MNNIIFKGPLISKYIMNPGWEQKDQLITSPGLKKRVLIKFELFKKQKNILEIHMFWEDFDMENKKKSL